MKKIIFLLFVLTLLINGCKDQCSVNLYTSDEKCCNYICDKACENGYIEGSCHCECAQSSTPADTSDSDEDLNLDAIFDDSDDVTPPPIPI
ncbi:MAG: hypothetical protein ABIC04_07265 [Nanoarchaeota archaeon]